MAESDLLAVETVENASFPDPWSIDSLTASFRNDMALVSEKDGRVSGYLFARMAADQAEILSLAVDPACRGQGTGRALLSYLISCVRSRACCRVFLEVRPSNLAARGLYEKAGFRVIDRRKKYYSNGDDALVMAVEIL